MFLGGHRGPDVRPQDQGRVESGQEKWMLLRRRKEVIFVQKRKKRFILVLLIKI